VFDDDHYYMGGVLAERCVAAGLRVVLMTPAAIPSAWTANTLEALPIARRLARLGVEVVTHANVVGFDGSRVRSVNGLTDAVHEQEARAVVTVTGRLPVDSLFTELPGAVRVGDCYAPGTIQAAVYSGHKCARELDENPVPAHLVPRELPG
jgi:dimethylamine/trimethylamine dehydrogenase